MGPLGEIPSGWLWLILAGCAVAILGAWIVFSTMEKRQRVLGFRSNRLNRWRILPVSVGLAAFAIAIIAILGLLRN